MYDDKCVQCSLLPLFRRRCRFPAESCRESTVEHRAPWQLPSPVSLCLLEARGSCQSCQVVPSWSPELSGLVASWDPMAHGVMATREDAGLSRSCRQQANCTLRDTRTQQIESLNTFCQMADGKDQRRSARRASFGMSRLP